VEFVSLEQDVFKTVNLRRISKGTSIEQDLGMIKERAKLYAHMSLIPILNRARLSTLPSIC
jgi:hypothetical protein